MRNYKLGEKYLVKINSGTDGMHNKYYPKWIDRSYAGYYHQLCFYYKRLSSK